MVETPEAVRDMRSLVDACEGRCVGAHLGAYDYLASPGIAAQELTASGLRLRAGADAGQRAGTGVWLSDGATNLLPLKGSGTSQPRGNCITTIHAARSTTGFIRVGICILRRSRLGWRRCFRSSMKEWNRLRPDCETLSRLLHRRRTWGRVRRCCYWPGAAELLS